jgi:hypothetical protein
VHLEAWLKPENDKVTAYFVAAGVDREPATQSFANEEEARRWIEAQAEIFKAPIKWGQKS